MAHQLPLEETENFLASLLEPMERGELEYRMVTSEEAYEISQELDGGKIENLYEAVQEEVKGEEGGRLDYSLFRDLGREIEQHKEHAAGMAMDSYEQVRREWEILFKQAKRVAGDLLDLEVDQWLTNEWIQQGMLTRNLDVILETVIQQKKWQEFLPVIGREAEHLKAQYQKRLKSRKYTTKKIIQGICLNLWQKNWQRLTLSENLELMVGLGEMIKNHPDMVISKNPNQKNELENPFQHLLAAQGKNLLMTRWSKPAGMAEKLGQIVKAQKLGLKDLTWLNNDKSSEQLFTEQFAETTINFLRAVDDQEFFNYRGPREQRGEYGELSEQLTGYEAWIRDLEKVVPSSRRAEFANRAKKIELEMTVGEPQNNQENKLRI